MGTRAAAFTAKIRNLSEFQNRLIQGVVPAPSGLDIASILKDFNRLLLGVLRDIKSSPVQMLRSCELDDQRLNLLPSLDYQGLYKAITNQLDLLQLVSIGKHALATAILQLLSTLMIFLDRDTVNTLPFLVATIISNTPETVHPFLLKTLCFNILPATVGASPKGAEDDDYSQSSVPAAMMLVLQYTENPAYHCQLIESLMAVKHNLIQDLICVIAYGTPGSRIPAANLLFYYWPNLNPTLFDRKGIHIKFSDISSVLKAMFNKPAQGPKTDSVSHTAANSEHGETKTPKGWKALPCQNDTCEAEGNRQMVKVCMDHVAALGACPDLAPPLYLCNSCIENLHHNQSNVELQDILMPMVNVSTSCENKNCRSTEKNAIATCFDLECCSYNNNRPIRYCSQCNTIRHNTRRGDHHRVHTAITCIWDQPPQMLNFIIECIVSLLGEAQPIADKAKSKDSDRINRTPILEDTDGGSSCTVEDGRVLSRYGVWLVVGLCTPNENTPVPILGRLLGALCHWFTATHYMPDDQQGATIERLKSDHLQAWLQEVCKTHMDVFVDCLLPHPPEYCRVGGHWETLSPRTEHVQEGFRRLFCLVPYDVITAAVWERVMPHWLEAICRDVTEEHLITLKITLSKLLDPEMSPLGFDTNQMYHFLAVRFENTSANVQEQNLQWLQMLSSVNIVIPIYHLLSMFETGVDSSLAQDKGIKKSSSEDKDGGESFDDEAPEVEPVVGSGDGSSSGLSEDEGDDDGHKSDSAASSDPELILSCYVLMLDIIYKQMEVQDIVKHQGINSGISTAMWQLLNKMLHTPCLISHQCQAECNMCYLINTFFQISTEILIHLCPKLPCPNNRVADMIPNKMESAGDKKADAGYSTESSKTVSTSTAASTSTAPAMLPSVTATGLSFMGVMAVMPQIVTATVDTVGEMDVVASMPQEQVMEAVATASTCTDEDLDKEAHATASVATASVVGADDEPVDTTLPLEEEEDVWVTSQGKFKFKIEDLPPHLQVIYGLLERLTSTTDGDEVYHICLCLRYLVLHGEALAQAATNHRGLLLWCQENVNINIMWTLIIGEWSHVAEVCVGLLLHFITLPQGADIFWKLCENHFNHTEWNVRFQAVEKVVVIGRFLTIQAVRQCPGLQGAVAHAFCFLVASLDDINVAVAQRASLGITSLPDPGLRALCWCLEQQFDSVILDRPMIIQTLHQLCSCLPDRRILTWDFFYNRFDALYLESQIALEKHGEIITFPRDLRNSDMTSDIFARKLSRAQDALSLVQSTSVKTLSSSLGPKYPYKRTRSAPANMLNKIDKPVMTVIEPVVKQRDKSYSRQYSVPILKQRSSKSGFAAVDGAGTMAGGGLGFGGGGGSAALKVLEDSSMMQQLQRAMDLEETDKDTLHLLIFLFMQFLSKPEHAGGSDEKGGGKTVDTVLRHIAALMGYSVVESNFTIGPVKLRASPVFNSFIANLPQVLDHNFEMGKKIIRIIVPVLQYCPATHRITDLRQPSYSLWMLQPTIRKCWLTCVLTVFYKFDCDDETYLKGQVNSLIFITMNTLDRHFHRCPRDHVTALATSSIHYSREVSQGSVGGGDEADGGGGERCSPATGAEGVGGKITLTPATPTIPEVQASPSAVLPSTPAITIGTQHSKHDTDGQKKEDEIKDVWYDASSFDAALVASSMPPPSQFSGRSFTGTQLVEEDENESTDGGGVVQYAVAREVHEPELIHAEPATAVTSVMASQILAFDDSFTVKIHNTEFADDDDSGLQRLSEKALEGLRSRFAASALEVHGASHQSLSMSNTETSGSPLSCNESAVGTILEAETTVLPRDATNRRINALSHFSSSTPKSSGSSQRSSTSYWLSSSTSTDSSCDFNVSRAATKLAFEICYEEDAESWSASETSEDVKNNNNEVQKAISKPSGVDDTAQTTEVNTPIGNNTIRASNGVSKGGAVVAAGEGNKETPHSINQLNSTSEYKLYSAEGNKVDELNNNGEGRGYPHVAEPEGRGEAAVVLPPVTAEGGACESQQKTGLMVCSPQSPLSMMELITVGSPIPVDCNTRSGSVEIPSPKQLELPTPERLLDGGETQQCPGGEDGQQTILNRVWQVLGGGWTSDVRQAAQGTDQGDDLLQVVTDKDFDKAGVDPTEKKGKSNKKSEKEGNVWDMKAGLRQERPIKNDTEQLATRRDAGDTSRGAVQKQGSGGRETALQRQQAVCGPSMSPEKTQVKGRILVAGTRTEPFDASDKEDQRSSDGGSSTGPPPSSMKQSDLRVGEECMIHRCLECGEALEEFSNEDLGMCIIILSTFVHRKPAMAAPHLPRMLHIVARVAGTQLFSWQNTTNVHLPGSATSIGGQFLRCVLHQLAPNQIFYQIFTTCIEEHYRVKLFRTLSQALLDFNELNTSAPVQSLLENLNERKELPTENMANILSNVACYMECVHQDNMTVFSVSLFPLFETFLRKLDLCFNIIEDVNPLLRLLCAFFKIPGVVSQKSILDPVSKAVVFSLRNAPVKYSLIVELCFLCSRSFPRERDKLFLARMMALELVQALKFKVFIPDTNLVLLVQLILQDNGGTLGPNPVLEDLHPSGGSDGLHASTMLAECVRASYLNDIIDFIADVHTLTKIKSGLNQDTIGGLIKSGLSQYLALEIGRGATRDTRFFNKFLPWLNSPPTTVQQGPKEFLECVGHIRLLSWLLLGSLMHTCHQTNNSVSSNCMPVPPDASCHIADHIQVILTGFPEQSKASVVNMSSLFLAFILSQIWTVYLEQNSSSPGTDQHTSTCALLIDFWAKVTHSILTLVKHSKMLGEMVSLHFLSLLEALQECGSTVLARLLPLWVPLLHSPYLTKLPDQLAVRLQACQDAIPLNSPGSTGYLSTPSSPPQLNSSPLSSSTVLPNLLKWLNRLQFKMGQIELQSSAATQIYSL